MLDGLLAWMGISTGAVGLFIVIARRDRCECVQSEDVGLHSLPEPANDNPCRSGRRRLPAGLLFIAVTALVMSWDHSDAQPLTLPTLKVESSLQPSCVDVEVQGSRSLSFDCLNQQLRDVAHQQTDAPPAVSAKDVVGTGAPTAVGTFSYTGTSIRMGNAFGKSATSQRPPAPSFTTALVPHVAGAR